MRKLSEKIMLYGLCLVLVTTSLSGCEKKDNTNATKTNTASPEPTKRTSLEDPNSNLGAWGRAMGAVLISMNEGDVYYFGGYEVSEANEKSAVEILKSSWGIQNRDDLLLQIQELLDTGARKEYRKEAKEMNKMSKKQLKTAFKQLSGETLVHYQMVQYNWKQWKKKGLIAWDMCRISHLVQWGYIAGYLSIKESQTLLLPAAEKLKKNFTNWDDVQKNWLDGYALFTGIDANQPQGTDYEKRQSVYEQLKKNQETEGILFDDSLFTSEITTITGMTPESILQNASKTTENKTTEDTNDSKE